MSGQTRVSAIADAEGEAEQLREDCDLPGEIRRGPYLEMLRCDDCGLRIETTRETVGGRWRGHRQTFGCQGFTLLWKTNYRDPHLEEDEA